MPRRYRRRRYAVSRPVKTTKYSNETYNFSTVLTSQQPNVHGIDNVPILPVLQNVSFLGTRKAKNFTVKVAVSPTVATDAGGNITNVQSRVYWALVYVPEGTNPSAIAVGTGAAPSSMYDPNQNVIMTGVISSVNPVTINKSRLARNLNSNDQLYICLYDAGMPSNVPPAVRLDTEVYVSINFAIAF